MIAVLWALLHFPFDPLHSAIAEANELRHAIDTEALPQRQPCLIDRVRVIQRSPKLSAIGNRSPKA
jgi:hypothetical protein